MPSVLDSLGNRALMFGAGTGLASGANFARIVNIAT